MEEKIMNNIASNGKVGHDQLYDLLTSQELSWQQIIYDLIQSEQLDPWDIDLTLLTRSYLDKIKELEEMEFYISSKILFAAAILLRIKSEFLLKRYIKNLDDILYGKPEEKEKVPFYMEIEDVNLLPRTPFPRQRKVTLQELMSALNKAIDTEHRRIKKEIAIRQASRDVSFVLPRRTINIKEKIREIYKRIIDFFIGKQEQELTFTQLAGQEKSERIATFIPLLHLDFQRKINVEQKENFGEIYISIKKFNFIPVYMRGNNTSENEKPITKQDINEIISIDNTNNNENELSTGEGTASSDK